jgi:ABC-2 type transport system ATP-binding protein
VNEIETVHEIGVVDPIDSGGAMTNDEVVLEEVVLEAEAVLEEAVPEEELEASLDGPDAPSEGGSAAAVPQLLRLAVPRLSLAKLGLGKLGLSKTTEVATTEIPHAEPTPVAKPSAATKTIAVKPAGTAQVVDDTILQVVGLTKHFDEKVAVEHLDLTVHVGAFYGIVGPNGAGKTTTLSMITGLLRPDSGAVSVNGANVWDDPVVAKRNMGVLPDRLRLFDRLTGAQVLYYAGVLRGLDAETARKRTTDLAAAFGLEDTLGRLVSDYSAGMTKKIALAAAMIHSPRLLVLDEPFESVDPVSAATVTEILKNYVEAGGTVVLSSHSMDLVQRICDHVAVIVNGIVLADGTMEAVRDGQSLEERFVQLAGGRKSVEGLEWLHTFSD